MMLDRSASGGNAACEQSSLGLRLLMRYRCSIYWQNRNCSNCNGIYHQHRHYHLKICSLTIGMPPCETYDTRVAATSLSMWKLPWSMMISAVLTYKAYISMAVAAAAHVCGQPTFKRLSVCNSRPLLQLLPTQTIASLNLKPGT